MFGLWAVVLVGVILAYAGVTDGVDSIVHYVFAIVDAIPPDPVSLLKPVYNPEPMYTHAYRPLSTVLVKLGAFLFGRDDAGLKLFTFAHGLLIIPYGLAARHFLVAHGWTRSISTCAALTSMLTPTLLFSAWTIPEFDMVGGAFVLYAAAELRRGRMATFVPAALLALLTKETSAVLMFAYLLAHAFVHRKESNRGWWIAGGYIVILLLAVAPILMIRPSVVTDYNVASDSFEWMRVPYLLFHHLSQVFYIVGPAGALLLVWALKKQWLDWPVTVGAGVLFGLAPLLRHYNHYESIIFSHWAWVLVWMLSVVFALAFQWRGESNMKLISLTLGLGFCGLLVGPVLVSFTRADLSARLFAPFIPMLHGIIWVAVADIFAMPRGRMQCVGVAVALCFLWQPVAGTVNSWQLVQSRFPVELQAKRELLSRLASPCPWVFYSNRDHELAQEELDVLGAVDEEVRACTKLIQLSETRTGPGRLWDYPKRLDGFDQFRETVDTVKLEVALRERRALPHQTHLYVQGARSTMTSEANQAFDQDFEWATQRMPETDIGYFQQTVGIVYSPSTPLERLFDDAAPYKKKHKSSFIQLPLWLNELPRRLLQGVPILEEYEYRADVYSIPLGTQPTGTPEPPGPPQFEH